MTACPVGSFGPSIDSSVSLCLGLEHLSLPRKKRPRAQNVAKQRCQAGLIALL